jgi:hypothetical protein
MAKSIKKWISASSSKYKGADLMWSAPMGVISSSKIGEET